MAAQPFYSPLRYPGGKRKVARYLCQLFEENGLNDGHYVEPFCGGASVALAMLFGLYAGRIHLNDYDPAVYAFWYAVLYETDALSRLIEAAPLSMAYRQRQQRVLADPAADHLARGFAAFYLNRTSHSGILRAGVMGGQAQAGESQLGDRYNRGELLRRIHKVARHESRIRLSNLDAEVFLARLLPTLDDVHLVYLDPPYYVKGPGLYNVSYTPAQHARLAATVRALRSPWVVSYDAAPAVLRLYQGCPARHFGLHYSAQDRVVGSEVMFFSPRLHQPAQGLSRTMHPAPARPAAQLSLSL